MKIEVKQPRNDRPRVWAMEEKALRLFLASTDEPEPQTEAPAAITEDGIAIVPIVGPIAKYQSLEMFAFGGTSTLAVEQIIQQLVEDTEVKGILLYVDSPGGTVAGTPDLAAAIAQAKQSKPIWGYTSDRCCSAAYWLTSQCDQIFCNQSGFVGSIGVYTVIYDTSKQAEDAGIKVHLVKAGETKGGEEPGVPIDDLTLQTAQDEINDVYSLFVSAVAAGRRMTPQQATALADGRIHIAEKAKALGLIDGIGSLADCINSFKESMAEKATATVATESETPAITLETLQEQIASLTNQLAQAKAEKTDEPSTEIDLADEAPTPEQRLAALKAIAPDRADFAIAQFTKGNDVAKAKAELADILMAENAELRKQATASGVEPVAVRRTITPANDLDGIWERNEENVQETFSGNKDYFLAVKKHEKKLATAARK